MTSTKFMHSNLIIIKKDPYTGQTGYVREFYPKQITIKTDPYKSLEMKASYLLDGMAKIMKSNNIDFVKNQMGGMFGFFFTSEMPNNFEDVVATSDSVFIKFLNACIANGVYFAPSKYEAGFISTQHDENILNMVLEKIELIVKEGL